MSEEKKITFCGKDWVIPHETEDERREILRIAEGIMRLQARSSGTLPENLKQCEKVIEILHAVFSPRYPELTED
jgi:hypothetical protein